jgi:hypothetical protein
MHSEILTYSAVLPKESAVYMTRTVYHSGTFCVRI